MLTCEMPDGALANLWVSFSSECANKAANGSPVWENAPAIAVKNAFVSASVAPRLDEQYVCLYGTLPGKSSKRSAGIILILLFLLAVRCSGSGSAPSGSAPHSTLMPATFGILTPASPR